LANPQDESALVQIREKDTSRLEAFSDCVFAFAITLLVLSLKDPAVTDGGLLRGLLNEWPDFVAFVASFMTILIIWVGHHQMFNYVVRVDRRFLYLNGFLLFFVTLTPFTTSLVANHLLDAGARDAAIIYSFGFLLLSLVWNLSFRYATRGRRLVSDWFSETQMKRSNKRFLVGPLGYAAALLLAVVSGVASITVIIAVAVFYAVGV